MKEVLSVPWTYTLYGVGDGYLLVVVCGRSALYDVSVRLNADEASRYEKDGQRFIDQLAQKVLRDPDLYANR
jgi:hypothetical protein